MEFSALLPPGSKAANISEITNPLSIHIKKEAGYFVKFSRDTANGNRIVRYEVGCIHLSTASIPSDPAAAPRIVQRSVIVTVNQIVTDWTPQHWQAITTADMDRVLATRPDVILLGTGKRLRFPPPPVLAHCQQQRVGMEVMDTAAACRTYNILAAEGRNVAAALLMISDQD